MVYLYPTESPRDDMKGAGNDEHDDVDGADGLYQVPPPAKPIDDLPPKYVKTVSFSGASCSKLH